MDENLKNILIDLLGIAIMTPVLLLLIRSIWSDVWNNDWKQGGAE